MAHSKEAHGKHKAMSEFNDNHWEKKPGETMCADGKYANSEMGNPEELKNDVNALASYAKKNKMKY
jgi:hypothetical protein